MVLNLLSCPSIGNLFLLTHSNLILILTLFIFTSLLFLRSFHCKQTFYSYFFAQNISHNESSSILSSSFSVDLVLLSFWWILCYQTLEIWNSKRITIMGKDKFIIFDFNSNPASSKLVGHILGILDQLPNPSDSWVLILCQVVDVLCKFLSNRSETSPIFGHHIFCVGEFSRINWRFSLHKRYQYNQVSMSW